MKGRIAQHVSGYQLLDSGGFQKLERFGDIVLARPCAQAVWHPSRPEVWRTATATFSRENGNRWEGREKLPATWVIEVDGINSSSARRTSGTSGFFPNSASSGSTSRGNARPSAGGTGARRRC